MAASGDLPALYLDGSVRGTMRKIRVSFGIEHLRLCICELRLLTFSATANSYPTNGLGVVRERGQRLNSPRRKAGSRAII
jgi:hypothetical protein